MKYTLGSESCFLDTSFIISSLFDCKPNASDLLTQMLLKSTPIYTNIIVFSELLNFLEKVYFKKDFDKLSLPEKDRSRQFKLWRKTQKGAYSNVLSEFRGIIETLKNSHNIELVSLSSFDKEINALLEEKKKFPCLDANDCLIYLSAKKHSIDIDLLVNSDSDYSVIDSEKCLPNNLSVFT